MLDNFDKFNLITFAVYCILQVTFVVLRFCEVLLWPWLIVFLPTIILGSIFLISIGVGVWAALIASGKTYHSDKYDYDSEVKKTGDKNE